MVNSLMAENGTSTSDIQKYIHISKNLHGVFAENTDFIRKIINSPVSILLIVSNMFLYGWQEFVCENRIWQLKVLVF